MKNIKKGDLVQVMTGELERSAMADYSFSSPGSSDNF